MTDVSVCIPVGNNPVYLEWLPECIDSVMAQTKLPTEIIFVGDGFALPEKIKEIYPRVEDTLWLGSNFFQNTVIKEREQMVRLASFNSPHATGVADAMNFGITLAQNNLVFTLASDDKMMPTCLAECVKEYDKQKIEGWYNVTIITQAGVKQWLPNQTAMVTRELWAYLGGFPPSAGIAACDALALSILMKHAPERIIQVKQGTPLCWLREHEHQDTKKNMAYFAISGVIEVIRDLETKRFEPHG